MLEPYVLKGTRTVLRRGEVSNHFFLFDVISSEEFRAIFQILKNFSHTKQFLYTLTINMYTEQKIIT